MGSCAACFTYGAAAGIDLSAGVVCLTFATRRTSQRSTSLTFGLMAVAAGGSTGLLCALPCGDAIPPATVDVVFAFATVSVVLPLVWFVASAWSHQQDDDRLPVAVFHLLVTAVFALNRSDALVVSGAIDPPGPIGPVLLQPLALPVAIVGVNVVRLRPGRSHLEASVRSHRLDEHRASAAAGERDRIARELHDSVTQTLYSVAMVADALPRVVAEDPIAARQQAGQIRSMTLTALSDLRGLVLEMRQPRFEPAGLATLLQQLSHGPDGLVRVDVDDAAGESSPPAPVRIAVHRIARQAVANARQHAGPSAIIVRLRRDDGDLELTVADDGAGFDPDTVAPGHHGLAIMRERATGVDGDLSVESAPGAGTTVRFRWAAVSFPPTRLVGR